MEVFLKIDMSGTSACGGSEFSIRDLKLFFILAVMCQGTEGKPVETSFLSCFSFPILFVLCSKC